MGDQLKLGGLLWVLTAGFFLAQMAAQWAAPGHDLLRYDISLLGISGCGVYTVATSGSEDLVCSPLYIVFNAGIIIYGALAILGIWITRNAWPKDLLTSWGLFLLALGGIGAMVVGAFPLDDQLLIHVLGAVTAIAAPGFGLLLLARSMWQKNPTFARWTALVAVTVLLAGLGHAVGGQPFGRGAMERLAVWPQNLWYMGLGLSLMLAQSQPARIRRTA